MSHLTQFTISNRTTDPQAVRLVLEAQALGFHQITHFECYPLYFVEGDLTETDKMRLALNY